MYRKKQCITLTPLTFTKRFCFCFFLVILTPLYVRVYCVCRKIASGANLVRNTQEWQSLFTNVLFFTDQDCPHQDGVVLRP